MWHSGWMRFRSCQPIEVCVHARRWRQITLMVLWSIKADCIVNIWYFRWGQSWGFHWEFGKLMNWCAEESYVVPGTKKTCCATRKEGVVWPKQWIVWNKPRLAYIRVFGWKVARLHSFCGNINKHIEMQIWIRKNLGANQSTQLSNIYGPVSSIK